MPIVFTMRQPPIAVPSAIGDVGGELDPERDLVGRRHVEVAQPAGRADEVRWVDTSRPTMMPIVFCASLAPWLSE